MKRTKPEHATVKQIGGTRTSATAAEPEKLHDPSAIAVHLLRYNVLKRRRDGRQQGKSSTRRCLHLAWCRVATACPLPVDRSLDCVTNTPIQLLLFTTHCALRRLALMTHREFTSCQRRSNCSHLRMRLIRCTVRALFANKGAAGTGPGLALEWSGGIAHMKLISASREILASSRWV